MAIITDYLLLIVVVISLNVTFNQVVRGSSPGQPTSICKGLRTFDFLKIPFVRKFVRIIHITS